MRDSDTPWLMCYEKRACPQIKLICLPYGGGSAELYRRWSRHLGPEIEIHAVELPGHGVRMSEPPMTRLEELVAELTCAIRPLLGIPYAIFGHSVGAAIAHELTRSIVGQMGLRPRRLFLSGHAAPHVPSLLPRMHPLSDDQFLREIERIGGTPKEVFATPELVQVFLPILRADFELIETFEFISKGPLDCGLTILGGSQDPHVEPARLDEWRRYTTGDFRAQVCSGDHFFPWSSLPMVAKQIQQDLFGS